MYVYVGFPPKSHETLFVKLRSRLIQRLSVIELGRQEDPNHNMCSSHSAAWCARCFSESSNLAEIIHLMDFKMKWWSAKEVISDPLLSSSIEHSQRSMSRPGKNNKPSATCAAADGPTSVDSCPGWFASLWAEQKDWVSQLLPKSQATWQIAVTHFPCGHEQGFYKSLANMGLDLLVTGHRHDQELWLPDDYAKNHMGITCIVTGGGGGITSEATPDPDHTEADHSGFGIDMVLTWFILHDFSIADPQICFTCFFYGFAEHENSRS